MPAPQRTARIEDEIWNPAMDEIRMAAPQAGNRERLTAVGIAFGLAALVDISALLYAVIH